MFANISFFNFIETSFQITNHLNTRFSFIQSLIISFNNQRFQIIWGVYLNFSNSQSLPYSRFKSACCCIFKFSFSSCNPSFQRVYFSSKSLNDSVHSFSIFKSLLGVASHSDFGRSEGSGVKRSSYSSQSRVFNFSAKVYSFGFTFWIVDSFYVIFAGRL